jgi:hypothetical protein
MFFFWYKNEERAKITTELRHIGREDLIHRLYDKAPPKNDNRARADYKPYDKRKKRR